MTFFILFFTTICIIFCKICKVIAIAIYNIILFIYRVITNTAHNDNTKTTSETLEDISQEDKELLTFEDLIELEELL